MLPAALFLAFTGTLLLFDATPGVNWGIWVTLGSAGILGSQWMETGRIGRATVILTIIACALAWGAAVTASPVVLVLDVLVTFAALSLAVLSQPDERGADVTIPRLVFGPVEATVRGIHEAGSRVQGAVVHARREDALPALRGVAIAVPVVGIFGLALSEADPTLAAWRVRTFAFLTDFPVGEIVFGLVLFIACLGAFGLAARDGRPAPTVYGFAQPVLRLGTTERLIVWGSIAALFACFLLLQISYLFGNAPAVPGSGVTFAEYARRGFFELTFVACACGALLTVMRGDGGRPGDIKVIQLLELTVLGEVALLLVSAFRKMLLYESAYGYTVERLWVQGFMVVLALSLAALAWELRGAFDVHRLARRAAGAAAAMLLVFNYWNYESWITRRNLERYAENGRFDHAYVVRELSPDALPAALEAAHRIGGVQGACMESALRKRWTGLANEHRSWFEFNLAGRRARRAMTADTASHASMNDSACMTTVKI